MKPPPHFAGAFQIFQESKGETHMRKILSLILAASLLLGLGSAMATESPTEIVFWHSMGGVNGEAIAKMVDAWYTANPQQLDRPVMSVIWREIIEPRLNAK